MSETYFNPCNTAPVSMKAGGAIPANSVVKLDSTEGQVVVCTAITDVVFGVALTTLASGDMGPIQTIKGSLVKMIAKNAVTLGQQLMPSTTTGAVSTASGATARNCGVCMQSANDGETFTAFLASGNVDGPVQT